MALLHINGKYCKLNENFGGDNLSKTIPAISIILPMYNMEKYIGECLDSILAQTFQDFEVIIVDDCSKDDSISVVEQYFPKFNKYDEKLKLLRSEVNSGGHVGTPRNMGIKIARGKYLYFMDSDDAIINNALEVLYKTAEKFNADVVHGDKFLKAPGETVTNDKNMLEEISLPNADIIYKPTLLSDNLTDRVNKFVARKMRWEPWNHLVSRKLLVENDIWFSNLSIADDMVYFITVLFTAKKIVLIPDALYIWRTREDSNSRIQWPVEKTVQKVGGDIIHGIKYLNDFFNKHKIFADKPMDRLTLLNFVTHFQLPRLSMIYMQAPEHEIYELFRKEIEKVDDNKELTLFFFSRLNVLQLNVLQMQSYIQQQQAKINELQRQLENRL